MLAQPLMQIPPTLQGISPLTAQSPGGLAGLTSLGGLNGQLQAIQQLQALQTLGGLGIGLNGLNGLGIPTNGGKKEFLFLKNFKINFSNFYSLGASSNPNWKRSECQRHLPE